MSLQQKTIKGLIWSFVQKWCGQLISTTVFLLLARLLGPEAFGLVALASVFIAFMQAFIDQGFAEAIIQRSELEPEHLDTAFWTSILMGLILTIATIVSAKFIAYLLQEPKLVTILYFLSANFLFTALQSVQIAILRRKMDFQSLAIRSLIATFVSGIVSLVMAFRGFGVWSLVGQQLTNGIVATFVLWQSSDWRPKFTFSLQHFRELFSFGINVTGLQIIKFINRRSDDFLIGYFLGSVALGYYTVAYRLLLVMVNILTSTVTGVALPVFARLQEEPERLRQGFYKATQFTSFIAFPAFCGVIVLAPELVKVFFGDEWISSIPVMQVLSLIGILQSVSYFNGTVMTAMGKPLWRLKINCVSAIVNVIGFLIAIYWKKEILAVAISFVLTGYLLAPVYLWIIYKLIKINIVKYFYQYLAPSIASLVMMGALMGTKILFANSISTYMMLGIYTLVAVFSYGFTIILIAPKLYQQILELIGLVFKKTSKIK